MTLTPPSGARRQSLSVEVTAQPLEGDTVTLGLTLPDGTEQSDHAQGRHRHAGGRRVPDRRRCRRDGRQLLGGAAGALTAMSNTELAVGVELCGGRQFLQRAGPAGAARPGTDIRDAPRRSSLPIRRPPCIWYKGEDAANARDHRRAPRSTTPPASAMARRPTRAGTLALMRSLASLAIQSFTNADTTSQGPLRRGRQPQLSRGCRRATTTKPARSR